MKKIITLALAGIFALSTLAFADMKKAEKEMVTKAEYLKMAEDRFNKIDANKDGTLTPDERKAYWQAKKLEYQQKKDLKGDTKKS